ncbi:hypothetical protein T440DRAFT_472513 [Plenodomus tracheiphilus IPT5]|uniref:Uncharacterized protein n=1 Tax=Plenodomus tracheiphilus IPT5 TaxID=1408161 RepID=A0A6A7AQR7_9PLEO|nr:hypothetical protein T440DRAFT_472513 [Plenodomus tracheiphilus IPT5]
MTPIENKDSSHIHVDHAHAQKKARNPVVGSIVGTIKLFDQDHIVLIPTPTGGSKDTLSLPKWQKYIILVVVGLSLQQAT